MILYRMSNTEKLIKQLNANKEIRKLQEKVVKPAMDLIELSGTAWHPAQNISKLGGYYIRLKHLSCIIHIKTLLKHIKTLLYQLKLLQFLTIISYYIIRQKSTIISIISLLLYQLFLFESITTIISIKTILSHLF